LSAMALPELIARIDELQARIAASGPLSASAKEILDMQFRLEWNYNSNVMEGNSLTRQETRTLMLGNVKIADKPVKDVMEMIGHDNLVAELLRMAKGEHQLSESRIKLVHRAIMHAENADQAAWIGEWKKVPNYLYNFKGERIDFTPPEQVVDAMHTLLDRTKAGIDSIERGSRNAPHPALLSFDFHREFVSIHPFNDGNGRTARIFSNVILLRLGYPPLIVKMEEKEAYNRYLAEIQGYGAEPDLFNEFMAGLLIRSQQSVLDAYEAGHP
ncbi:MAG: Fic family protein, partial [Flavobacteriales bacterium]